MWTVDESRPACLRVAVLCGGQSDERSISLQSGAAVARALAERGHQVTTIDPACTPLEAAHFRDVDVAFLALHGRNGEDGRTQSLLDRMGVVYTGSGPEVSRVAFSKSASKERFFQCGVPTPAYVLVHQSDADSRARELAERIGFPLVVKPDTQGSSLGVRLVRSLEHLADALANCFRYDEFGLFEQAVLGSEWTLGLLDDEPLPAIRIESPREIFDFDAKYSDEATAYHFPGDSEPAADSVVEAGCRAARALGTRGLARVDLRVDERGTPWVLEVNTIPGLTEHSLIPKASLRAGFSLGELCERSIFACLTAIAARRAPLRGPHRKRAWRPEPKRA